MITQYSHTQMTLNEEEKFAAWLAYAARLQKQGCMDQSLSGYVAAGMGAGGETVKAELTNEELFSIFMEMNVKFAKEYWAREQQRKEQWEEQREEAGQPIYRDLPPSERKDFLIHITKHTLKTRRADVSITWGENLKVSGIRIHAVKDGGVKLAVPAYYTPGGDRVELAGVGKELEKTILDAYRRMDGRVEAKAAYRAGKTGLRIQARRAQEGNVAGYADVSIGDELQIRQVRIWKGSRGVSCLYPSEASGPRDSRQWKPLVKELGGCSLQEQILGQFQDGQPDRQAPGRQAGMDAWRGAQGQAAGSYGRRPGYKPGQKQERGLPEEEEGMEL